MLLSPLPLRAQKPGQPFVSPLKNFTVTVPDFLFGTRVQKSNNRDGGLVVFIGGFGDLQRIDYVRLTPATLAELAMQDSAAREETYRRSLDLVVEANHAEVVALAPLSLSGEPALYALVRFPEASQVMQGGRRLDSTRGVLVLARGDFLYTLAVEVGGLPGERLTRDQQAENGKRDVQRFLGEISFQGSPIPVARDTVPADAIR